MSPEDLIHWHVQQHLEQKPEDQKHIQPNQRGGYTIRGREVKVGLCAQGCLVVRDGPLRQPFVDYVDGKESTAVYQNVGLKKSTISQVPKEARISFEDDGNRFNRLDAMKIAKEQARFREEAANFVNQGQTVPSDLMDKYEKTIELKLGQSRVRKSEVQSIAPAWWQNAKTPASAKPAAAVKTQPAAASPQIPSQNVPVVHHQPSVSPASVAVVHHKSREATDSTACERQGAMFAKRTVEGAPVASQERPSPLATTSEAMANLPQSQPSLIQQHLPKPTEMTGKVSLAPPSVMTPRGQPSMTTPGRHSIFGNVPDLIQVVAARGQVQTPLAPKNSQMVVPRVQNVLPGSVRVGGA